MLKLAVLFMNLLSSPTYAESDLERCGSLADRKLKAMYQTVAFPAEYIQWGFVDRIERTDFHNTTPGSMYQEYAATYKLTYKPAPYAYFTEQVIHVEYQSPFVCEELKVKCVQVLSSKTASSVDPSTLPKTGPLACAR